jgi:hypothetical protein
VKDFELCGAAVAEAGVTSAGVVERLGVVEDGELGLASGGEPAAGLLVEQLALQRCEHALGQGVVEAVRDAAHAGQRAVAAQLAFQGVGAVLPPRSLWWITPGTRPPRRCTAMVTASTTRSVLRWEAIDQPMTIRLNTSVTQAR